MSKTKVQGFIVEGILDMVRKQNEFFSKLGPTHIEYITETGSGPSKFILVYYRDRIEETKNTVVKDVINVPISINNNTKDVIENQSKYDSLIRSLPKNVKVESLKDSLSKEAYEYIQNKLSLA